MQKEKKWYTRWAIQYGSQTCGCMGGNFKAGYYGFINIKAIEETRKKNEKYMIKKFHI